MFLRNVGNLLADSSSLVNGNVQFVDGIAVYPSQRNVSLIIPFSKLLHRVFRFHENHHLGCLTEISLLPSNGKMKQRYAVKTS